MLPISPMISRKPSSELTKRQGFSQIRLHLVDAQYHTLLGEGRGSFYEERVRFALGRGSVILGGSR